MANSEGRFGGKIMRAAFPEDGDVIADIAKKYNYTGDLSNQYANVKTSLVHKWHHYIPLYDKYFSHFRGTDFKMLEIGVSGGGSLQLWRDYFGKDAKIYGIDIDPACAKYDGQAGQVRIGSQDDPDFLNSVIDEMGGVDLVLDDGSHIMKHIRKSFEVLFPRLSIPGVYFIEDLHSAYWSGWGGGLDEPANIFNMVKLLADDMHRWYHDAPLNYPNLSESISSINIHDSIMVLEKAKTYRPTHSQIGQK